MMTSEWVATGHHGGVHDRRCPLLANSTRTASCSDVSTACHRAFRTCRIAIRRRHALRYPVSGCERSGSDGSAFAVNNHLCSGRRLLNEFHELLKLIHSRRTEVPHGNVVPHVTQSSGTCDIIPGCSLLLAE